MMPPAITEIIPQGIFAEKHAETFLTLQVEVYFSPWLSENCPEISRKTAWKSPRIIATLFAVVIMISQAMFQR